MNVSRLFGRWKDMHHLMLNLMIYKLEFASFGTHFFKEEILASN